jgi:hypothetical protein
VNAIGKLVVVRFLDRRVLKGRIVDFRPDRDFFHVEETEGSPAATRVEVEGLKAVFFVKTLEGNREHVEKRAFEERLGTEKKVWIEFTDGERLAGWSNSFASRRAGLYVFPADEDSNMEKAYVFRAAVARLDEGEAAEAASRAWQAEARPWGPPAAVARQGEAPSDEAAARAASAEEEAFAFETSPPEDEAPFVLDTKPLDAEEERPAGSAASPVRAASPAPASAPAPAPAAAPVAGSYRLGRGAIRAEGPTRGAR